MPKPNEKKRTKTVKSTGKVDSTTAGISANSKLLLFIIPVLLALFLELWYIYFASNEDELWDIRLLRDRTIFELVDVPGKGKGALAVRDIKQGEMILAEKPLATMPTYLHSSYFSELFQNYTKAQRRAFLDLTYVNLHPKVNTDPKTQSSDDIDAIAAAIVRTNGVIVGQNVMALFPRMARLNHGCAGAINSVYSWNDAADELRIFAIKDIPEGEELMTVYSDTMKPREDRRPYLETYYGFTCDCPVCSLPALQQHKSDKRLSKMAALNEELTSWRTGTRSGAEYVQLAGELWRLEQEENYFKDRGDRLATVVAIAAAHSDESAVREWGEISLKWLAIEYGVDNQDTLKMKRILQKPRSHEDWGKLAREDVGGPEEL